MSLASQRSPKATPVGALKARLTSVVALCSATALSGSAWAGGPAPNALPTIPTIPTSASSTTITPYLGLGTHGFQSNGGSGSSGGANTLTAPTYSTAPVTGFTVGTVTLNATRTILDWTSFQVGANSQLFFLFPGTTRAAIADDIVINRLQGSGPVDIAGLVEGVTSNGTVIGGQLWFLAPNGAIFEPGSTVFAGRIVVANAFKTTTANDSAFLTASGDDAALMRNGGSLIDLRGTVSASGATLDATGAILITGAISTGTAGAVTVDSTSTISADGAVITAGALTGSSVGGASFYNGANAIPTLTGFTNTGSGDFRLFDNGALTVTGSISTPGSITLASFGQLDTSAASLTAGTSGAGAVSLTTSLAATVGAVTDRFGPVSVFGQSGVTLEGPVTATGQALTVSAQGPIAADGAAIAAASLTGSSHGGASFNSGANAIGSLAGYVNAGSGGFTLSTNGPLGVTAPVSTPGALSLSATGALDTSAATLTAGTATTGVLTLTAGGAMTVGAVQDLGGGMTFSTTTAGAAITFLGAVAAGAVVAVDSAGTVSADTAPIYALGLTGSSVGGASFNPPGGDQIQAVAGSGLSGFTNTASGDFTLTSAYPILVSAPISTAGSLTLKATGFLNASATSLTAGTGGAGALKLTAAGGPLTVGAVTDTSGAVILAATGTAGSVTLAGRVTASGQTLTVNAAGAISGDAATISAASLTGSSAGGASFNNPSNAIGAFSGFADTAGGSVTVNDSQGLTLTGAIKVGTGTLTVTSGGAIDGDSAAITAGTLAASSSGGASFANQANAIAAVSTLANNGGGNIVLIDSTPGAALQLGVVTNTAGGAGSGSISLTQAAGDVTQAANSVLQGAGDVSVTVSAGHFITGTIVAGGDIAIDSVRFTSQPQSALQAGGSLAITTADPNGLVLADAAPSGSSSSWIGTLSLRSSSVTVTQSDISGIDIGAATIGVGPGGASLGEGQPRHAVAAGGAAQGANSPASLTILTPGPVTITGHLLPAAGTTPDLTIGGTSADVPAPSVIEIVNDNVAPLSAGGNIPAGGSIGEGVLNANGSYGDVQAFGAVSLTAQSYILAGTSAFIAANANSTAPPSAVNPLLNMPNAGAANLSGGVLIAADTLTLAAGAGVLQQNTSGLQTGGGSGLFSGLYVGGLTLAPYGQTGPAVFDVYGAVAGAAGVVTSGSAAATSGLITLSVTQPSGSTYRFNGCPIGQADACGGGGDVLAHVVSSLGQATPPGLAAGDDGDPPVIGPVAVDLVRKGAAVSGDLPKMSDTELFGVLTREVDRTLADYDLDPGRCYDVGVLGDDIYHELLKSDVRGVTGARLDLALRRNNTTLRDVVDQGVSEAAQQTAIYCQSRSENAAAPSGAASPDPLVEPARFGEVMARAREAVDRVPPKILVAVKHR